MAEFHPAAKDKGTLSRAGAVDVVVRAMADHLFDA